MGDLSTDYEKGFDLETVFLRNIPYNNLFWNTITYEMNQTRIEYTRIVYGFFDFLGELGGLFGAIQPLFALLVAIF